MRTRRLTVGAAAASLLLFGAPAALGVPIATHHDPAGSGLVSYTAVANAPGVGIDGIYMGVSLDLPQVHSALTTGGVGAGLASIAWPGDIGGNAGTAVFLLAPNAPPWLKILNDPIKAETHSTGTRRATNATIPGTVMSSRATHTLVTASSQTKQAIPGLGSLGAFSGSSTARLTGPHTIRAVASSAVSDLDLAGGLIKIAGLKSRSVVVSNGKTSHGHASTTVTGVTIAGLPVTVDKHGVHLSSSVLPTKPVTALLSKTLKALHLRVTFTPDLITRNGAAASYDSGALVLTYAPNTSTYTITLGRATAAVNATPSLLGDLGLTPPSSTPTATSGGTTGGASGTGASGVGAVGLPGGSSSVPADDQPPSVAHRIAAAASSVALAGGATGLMVFGIVVAMIACGFALPWVAGRFLDVPAGAGCEEDE